MGRRVFSNIATLLLSVSPAATALLVRTIRNERGWTLAQMSRATGIHVNNLREHEAGKSRPSPSSWNAILEAAAIHSAFLEPLLVMAGDLATAFSGDPPKPLPPSDDDLLPELQDLIRSATTLLERTPKPPAEPPDLEDQLGRLLACERSRRPAVIRLTEEFQWYLLALLCCEKSIRAAAQDPELARELAELAMAVADTVALPWRDRLRAYALAHLANALRVAENLDEADVLFIEAEALWESAPEDPGVLDPGLIYELQASLRRAQHRFGDAFPLLDRAERVSVAPGRVLLKRATVLEKIGSHVEALEALDRADSLLAMREPREEWILCHSRGVNLAHLGRYDEGRRFAEEAERWVRQTGNALDALRTDWLRGRVTESPAEARSLLDEVRQAFFAREMFYDGALASGEYCVLLMDDGQYAAVREIAADLVTIFEAHKVHEQALVALQLFQEAVARERASTDFARALVAYLYRARYKPDLCFTPPQ